MPGIVSSRIAATDDGPSAWITRSRWCSARSDSCSGVVAQNSERYRYGPKWCTCARAYSLGTRRQSPVATTAAPVLPWYERYADTTLSRPVCRRAIRIAFSLASAPPLVKNTLVNPSGAWLSTRSAARPRVRFAVAGATVVSVAACSWIAATTRGCWWPMLVLTSWLEKSRYRRPAWSHTVDPSPPAMTSGFRCACADHEWKTWSRSRRSAVASSSVVMVPLLRGAGPRAGAVLDARARGLLSCRRPRV